MLGIGKCIREEFEKVGAIVCAIDLLDNGYFVGDLACKEILEQFAKKSYQRLRLGGLSHS